MIGDKIVLAKVFYDNHFDNTPSSACVALWWIPQKMSNICKVMPVWYTIAFPEERWCKLFLWTDFNLKNHLDISYVKQILCPPGCYVCRCFLSLLNYGITCNINNQTILRPRHSWIFAVTNNNSYNYHISLRCSSFYCLPYSSHLKLSDPNSQCKFERISVLRGQCQQGFSIVFGSTKCQQCSSIYLLLIIPIAIVNGVAFLFLTSLWKLICSYYTYINIANIYSTMLFPQEQHNLVFHLPILI